MSSGVPCGAGRWQATQRSAGPGAAGGDRTLRPAWWQTAELSPQTTHHLLAWEPTLVQEWRWRRRCRRRALGGGLRKCDGAVRGASFDQQAAFEEQITTKVQKTRAMQAN